MPCASRAGTGGSAVAVARRGVVLEPGQAPRAVEPDAAQEADLADGRADVRATAASPPRARAARRPAGARGRTTTNTTAPTYAAPKTAQPPRARRRSPARAAPPARTSAPRPRAASRAQPRADAGDAHLLAGRRRGRGLEQVPREPVVRRARAPRPRARRPAARSRSAPSAARTARAAAAPDGSTRAAPSATPSRRIQPQVENSDMYMWSSTNTWLRSTDSRSRYSGRSWCAIVATVAWSCATCASSAIVTPSRKRRCTRSLTTRRNQVAAAETPRPTARRHQQRAIAPQHAVGEQLQPEREQRVGQRRQQREREGERAAAAARPVAEPDQPPHRGERRRHAVRRAAS